MSLRSYMFICMFVYFRARSIWLLQNNQQYFKILLFLFQGSSKLMPATNPDIVLARVNETEPWPLLRDLSVH